MTLWAGIGLLSLAVWLYLLVARGGYWLARERDDDLLADPATMARRRGGRSCPKRSRRYCTIHRQPARPGLCRAVPRRSRRRRQQRWHVRCRESNPERTTSRCRSRDGFAGRLDRQAMGAGAGHSSCHGHGRCHRLFPADRCRHWPCTRQPQPPGCTFRVGWPRPGLADGRAVLRDPGRALPHSRLRLFLPDAVSVRLGRAARSCDSRCCRRLHPGAPQCAGAGRRHSGHQVRNHRRLCAGASSQGPGPDLARPHAAGHELAALRRLPEDRPHDFAFRLRPARLLAVGACRHCRRHGAGLHRAAAARAAVRRAGALAGIVRLAGDGHHLPADAALLPPVAALGARAPCHRRCLMPSSPCSRRSTSGAVAAACGRAASRPWRETRDRRG